MLIAVRISIASLRRRFDLAFRVVGIASFLGGLSCLPTSALAQTPDLSPSVRSYQQDQSQPQERSEVAASKSASLVVPITYAFTTVDEADAAIRDVAAKRLEIEARNAQDLQACASRFFATRCVDAANERKRIDLARLRPIEIDANMFKRQSRVIERDKNLDEKRLKSEQQANAQPAESKGLKSSSIAPTPKAASIETHKQVRPPSIVTLGRLEENRAAFDRKAQEAAARQKMVAQRKAEKERDRLEKKAEKERADASAVSAAGATAAAQKSP